MAPNFAVVHELQREMADTETEMQDTDLQPDKILGSTLDNGVKPNMQDTCFQPNKLAFVGHTLLFVNGRRMRNCNLASNQTPRLHSLLAI